MKPLGPVQCEDAVYRPKMVDADRTNRPVAAGWVPDTRQITRTAKIKYTTPPSA